MKNEGIGFSMIDFAMQIVMGSMAIGIIAFMICVIGIISFPFIMMIVSIWIGWNIMSSFFERKEDKVFDIRDY